MKKITKIYIRCRLWTTWKKVQFPLKLECVDLCRGTVWMFINSKLLQQNHFAIIMHGRAKFEFLFKAHRACRSVENIKNWSFLRREQSVLPFTYSSNFTFHHHATRYHDNNKIKVKKMASSLPLMSYLLLRNCELRFMFVVYWALFTAVVIVICLATAMYCSLLCVPQTKKHICWNI